MSPRTLDDAAAQLRRLMQAIPALGDEAPHRMAEIAAIVGVSEEVLARDLRTLVTRYDDEPGGFVEGVQLAFGADSVRLRSQLYRRPMGLSPAELAALGEATGTTAPIALRVNPDVESPTPHHYTRTGHHETKFGIPLDEARRLYRAAAQMPGLRLRGVDVHIGSQILEVEPYVIAVERVLRLVKELRADGIQLEYIDIGGGYGIAYDEDEGPDAATFAAALTPLLQASGLRVVVEPGRYIVGPAGVLLTRVLYVKELSKTFVVTDAGMNDLLRPSHYASYHRVAPAEMHPERDSQKVDVVGPICESGDFLALDRVVERVREGELLVISTTGAYGFAMASTYNARPRPAEVLVDGASFRLIRRRETLEDLVRGEEELLSEWTATAS